MKSTDTVLAQSKDMVAVTVDVSPGMKLDQWLRAWIFWQVGWRKTESQTERMGRKQRQARRCTPTEFILYHFPGACKGRRDEMWKLP